MFFPFNAVVGAALVQRTAAFTYAEAVAEMAHPQPADKRRADRLADTARRISPHPGGSLPEKLRDPAAYRATLRLLNHPDVTHATVLEPHPRATRQRMAAAAGAVLVIGAVVEPDYSHQHTLGAPGRSGNGGGKGYECHNSLAVHFAPDERPGLARRILHTRVMRPPGEGVAHRRERPTRESLRWLKAADAVGGAPDGCHWGHVCDRPADTFEYLEHQLRRGRHFTIRSTHRRALAVASAGRPRRLHALLRPLPAQVGWAADVSANKGPPGRRAGLLCRGAAVTLKAPHVRKGKHGRGSLTVWALRVREVDAPADVKEPLEWRLLTDEPIADAVAARRRVADDERRPRVEEYHQAQKTGLSVEHLQRPSQAGLQPLIARWSVPAVASVNTRSAARDEARAGRPASESFDPVGVAVLSLWRYREERPLTVREFVLALGRLGGHLNRKCDGLPGWLTLWRGAMQLHTMVEYELARRSSGKL